MQQIEGIFEMKAAVSSKEEWTVDLPLEEKKWNVGLIVGPSGSGKSTIANEPIGKKFQNKKDGHVAKQNHDGIQICGAHRFRECQSIANSLRCDHDK